MTPQKYLLLRFSKNENKNKHQELVSFHIILYDYNVK